jgi:hypothetical protein
MKLPPTQSATKQMVYLSLDLRAGLVLEVLVARVQLCKVLADQ